MTETPDERDLDAFARRMQAAFATVPTPPSRPRAARARDQDLAPGDVRPRLVAVAACALLLMVGVGALAVSGRLPGGLSAMLPGHQQSSRVWTGHGLTIKAQTLAAQASCRLPVSVLATNQSGFVDITDSGVSFVPAAAGSGGTYVPGFHEWVNVLPQMVAPSGDAYVTESPSQPGASVVSIVRANGTTATWSVPSRAGALAWGSEGVILNRIDPDPGGAPPTLEMWLLNPSTGSIRPFALAPAMQLGWSGQLGYLPADDSFWTENMRAGSTTVTSQSLATGAVQTWYQGAGTAYVIAATPQGAPIIQIGSRDLGHLQPKQQNGVSEQTLLFTSPGHSAVLNQGVVGQPNVAADLGPLSATMGDTVWMADGQGGIWTYTAASGMREVAKVTTSNDGPPGIAISGTCG